MDAGGRSLNNGANLVPAAAGTVLVTRRPGGPWDRLPVVAWCVTELEHLVPIVIAAGPRAFPWRDGWLVDHGYHDAVDTHVLSAVDDRCACLHPARGLGCAWCLECGSTVRDDVELYLFKIAVRLDRIADELGRGGT
jgi:hypothetical protein